jgi:hypothetical protein
VTVEEAKNVLSLPALLHREGLGDCAKKSALCPFHDDKHNSFSIWPSDGVWFWKCHAGCGTGDEINFLEKQKGISRSDATKLFIKMAGGGETGSAPVARKAKPAVFDWAKCVAACTDEYVEEIARERGYQPEFVRELREAKQIGIHDGLVAFPVRNDGKIVGVHFRLKSGSWIYEPKGIKAAPLVIGELLPGDSLHVFESQWDAFAFMSVSGERSGIVITRGASNGALVAGVIPQTATVYVWPQNDAPGDKWANSVCAHTKAAVKRARIPVSHKDLNAWTQSGASAKDLLDAMSNAKTLREPERPLIEFRSPLQLKNFTPAPGLVLVGDFHIVKGAVFVEGGPPGVGKSRGFTALAVAGATGCDWFGYKVHRKFKTLIVQTENGEFRLAREFAELDCETLENFVRICPPPPYGLCFQRSDFRAQLAAAIADFKPDLVGFDPWNAAAREQDSREYLDTFDALKSVLPLGDNAPALGIVAHTRKPRTDERASGRALLNLLAGSYVLGSVPRTVRHASGQ